MMEIDRRHSRVSVTQLRRDLREADEDRFRLTVALARLGRKPNGTPRLLAIALLVTGGLGSAVGTTEAPTATMAQMARATTTPAMPADIMPLEIAAPTMPVLRERVRPVSRSTARTARSSTPIPKRTSEFVTLRETPRPMSPGEFGRPRAVRLTKVATHHDAN